jgi:hypothetical protein
MRGCARATPESLVGVVVLIAVTFALVGVLTAIFQHALESPLPGNWMSGIALR